MEEIRKNKRKRRHASSSRGQISQYTGKKKKGPEKMERKSKVWGKSEISKKIKESS